MTTSFIVGMSIWVSIMVYCSIDAYKKAKKRKIQEEWDDEGKRIERIKRDKFWEKHQVAP